MAGILAGILLFAAACSRLNFIYVKYDPWYRILFHSYEQQDRIDTLFLGSSHVFCDVDPYMLDKINGQNNFNLATLGQRWDVTYYLLKDALQKHDIQNVYLECYSWTSTEAETWIGREKGFQVVDYMDMPANYTDPWMITYVMKPSLNSLAMLYYAADADHMLETLFPFVRFRASLFDWEYVKENIEAKTSDEYKNYEYREEVSDADGTEGTGAYLGKGYYLTDNRRLLEQERIFRDQRDFDKYGIGKKSEAYIRKTIELCQARHVNVKLYVSPVYDLQLISTEDYDRYVSELKEIADAYDVELYDFNLIKKEYLQMNNGDLFWDAGHLNGTGARTFTPVLWEILSGQREENEPKFYRTYREKLAREDFDIYGVYYKEVLPGDEVKEDGSPGYTARHFRIASNRKNVRYRISRSLRRGEGAAGEDAELIQDYAACDSFVLPADQHGTLTIDGIYGGRAASVNIHY